MNLKNEPLLFSTPAKTGSKLKCQSVPLVLTTERSLVAGFVTNGRPFMVEFARGMGAATNDGVHSDHPDH